jgi:cysteine desulfurase family protein (TIGR01976 family)
MKAFASLLSSRTRIVAVTAASNAVGTLPDLALVARMAHQVGALVWVDAVHYGPHGPMDVQALGIDFLVCSAYKFFGPHLGIFYGREALLEKIESYQLSPAPHTVPEKFETGTKNHECLAGLVATIGYLEELGSRILPSAEATGATRREKLVAAMSAIRSYERELGLQLLEGLQGVPNARVYGITDPARFDERVPTFAFTIDGVSTPEIGRVLGEEGIFVWTGNYYALSIMEQLGLEGKGGAVRVGAVHYNTPEEIDRLISALKSRF